VWTTPPPPPAPQEAIVLNTSPEIVCLEYVTLPDLLDERLVMLREPESARARSYRLLRHRVVAESDPHVVAVTSARPGEGKTTCSLNLALALAEDTQINVLLLEANLRRPALATILGFEPTESLVQNFTHSAEVGPPYPVGAILGTRLHVAALPQTLMSEARLDRTQFAAALRELRDVYDYIVIDAAAVLESGDTDVVGECANGVVVTTRARSSRTRDVAQALDQLAPAPVLGTVLLDV
jgi:Mrp family chromosome partitioning ATPase